MEDNLPVRVSMTSSDDTALQGRSSRLSPDEIARIVAVVGAHYELRPAVLSLSSSTSQHGTQFPRAMVASTLSSVTVTNSGKKLK